MLSCLTAFHVVDSIRTGVLLAPVGGMMDPSATVRGLDRGSSMMTSHAPFSGTEPTQGACGGGTSSGAAGRGTTGTNAEARIRSRLVWERGPEIILWFQYVGSFGGMFTLPQNDCASLAVQSEGEPGAFLGIYDKVAGRSSSGRKLPDLGDDVRKNPPTPEVGEIIDRANSGLPGVPDPDCPWSVVSGLHGLSRRCRALR